MVSKLNVDYALMECPSINTVWAIQTKPVWQYKCWISIFTIGALLFSRSYSIFSSITLNKEGKIELCATHYYSHPIPSLKGWTLPKQQVMCTQCFYLWKASLPGSHVLVQGPLLVSAYAPLTWKLYKQPGLLLRLDFSTDCWL